MFPLGKNIFVRGLNSSSDKIQSSDFMYYKYKNNIYIFF